MNKKRTLCAYVTLLAILLCACSQNVIREDAARQNLPAIDPSLGMTRDENITFYFKLQGEDLLVPVLRRVTVGPYEDLGMSVVKKLIQGPLEDEPYVESAIPLNVKALDIEMLDTTARLTLSAEILGRGSYSGTQQEILYRQRMSVYAFINTLCASVKTIDRVEILIDTDNSGIGRRVSPFMLGFFAQNGSDWLEPLTKNEEAVATLQKTVAMPLNYLALQRLDGAYRLFYQNTLPVYDDFVKFFRDTCRITHYELAGVVQNDINLAGEAVLNLTWTNAGGRVFTLEGAHVRVHYSGYIYRLDYPSLTGVMLDEVNRND
ncbi:MAG: GerMN domain-containing protein [Clostridiales bacterium]|jgi:hypothetical protein|nr:GerMN domain-containing protein [Clostridiales bacterium]